MGKNAKRDAKAANKAKHSADDDYTSPKRKEYEARMAELQIELVRMQYWVKQQGLKAVSYTHLTLPTTPYV